MKNEMNETENDIRYMQLALEEAKRSLAVEEVPVGAVVVCEGEVVAAAYNTRETEKNAIRHAEVTAISRACEKLGGWRLHKCEIYVTLEPCPMCMGASLNARVDKIFFGAYEQKGRSLTSALAEANLLNHKTETVGGVLEEECSALLTGFFSSMRQKQKEEKERKKAEEENAKTPFIQLT